MCQHCQQEFLLQLNVETYQGETNKCVIGAARGKYKSLVHHFQAYRTQNTLKFKVCELIVQKIISLI